MSVNVNYIQYVTLSISEMFRSLQALHRKDLWWLNLSSGMICTVKEVLGRSSSWHTSFRRATSGGTFRRSRAYSFQVYGLVDTNNPPEFKSKVTPILGGTSWQLVQDTAFDSHWRNPEATTWLIPEGYYSRRQNALSSLCTEWFITSPQLVSGESACHLQLNSLALGYVDRPV